MSILYAAITDLVTSEGDVGADPPRLPVFEQLLAQATVRSVAGGWQAWALAQSGLTVSGAWPLARLLTEASARPSRSDARWWLATPMHLEAGMVTVRFDARGPLRLDAEALERLVTRFARDWAGSGYQLVAYREALLLETPLLPAVDVLEPGPLAGTLVEEARPAGDPSGALWRLLTELQMWLHAVGVTGVDGRTLNALWLWGAGTGEVQGVPRWPQLEVDDPLLRALATGDAAKTTASGDRLVEWSLAALWRAGRSFGDTDDLWWQPMLQELKEGRFTAALVYIHGREYRLAPPPWWSRWRRPRPWWQVLA